MIRLVALLGCMASASIAHNFTAVPGFLPADAPDAAPFQNVTLASAELICGARDACIGFSFRSPTATPSGVVGVHFKALDQYCGYSRFGDGICVSEDGTDWQVCMCTCMRTCTCMCLCRDARLSPSHMCVLPPQRRLSCLHLSDTVIRPHPHRLSVPTERTTAVLTPRFFRPPPNRCA